MQIPESIESAPSTSIDDSIGLTTTSIDNDEGMDSESSRDTFDAGSQTRICLRVQTRCKHSRPARFWDPRSRAKTIWR